MMSVSISQREKLLDMTVDIDQLYALYQRLVCRSIFFVQMAKYIRLIQLYRVDSSSPLILGAGISELLG